MKMYFILLLLTQNILAKVNFSLDSRVFSNFYKAESSSSQRFMTGGVGVSHPFFKKKFSLLHRITYQKQLEGAKEGELMDYRLSLTGLNFKISKLLNLSWTPRFDFVFDELRKNIASQWGAGRIIQNLSYGGKESIFSLSLPLIVIKNFHKFKTNFNGESNSSLLTIFGLSPAIQITDKWRFGIGAYLIAPISYSKGKKDLSSFEVSTSYQVNKNFNLDVLVGTDTFLLNDQGLARSFSDYIATSRSLVSIGARLTF